MGQSLADQVASAGNFSPVPSSQLDPSDGISVDGAAPLPGTGGNSPLDTAVSYVSAVKAKKAMDASQTQMRGLSALQSQADSLLAQMPAAEAEKTKADAEMQASELKSIQDARKMYASVMDEWKKKGPTPDDAPPDYTPQSPLEKFGSMSSLLGIFASAFTKTPVVNALNASAAAMKAANEGDKDAYEIAYKKWKDHADLAIKHAQEDRERLKDIIDLQGKDTSLSLAEAQALDAEKGWKALGLARAAGDLGAMSNIYESTGKALAEYKKSMSDVDSIYKRAQIASAESLKKERDAQTDLVKEKTAVLKEGGGLSSASKLKVEEQDHGVQTTLDDIDKALSNMDNAFAVAGVGGSIRNYAEPLSNLLGSDATAGAQFREQIASIKMAVPGIELGGAGGRRMSVDTKYIDDIVGGQGFKNSTANTYARLQDLRDKLLDQHKFYDGLLRKSDIVNEPSEETEDRAWQDAPLAPETE